MYYQRGRRKLYMESSKTYYGGVFINEEQLKESTIKNKVELEYYSTKKPNSLEEEGTAYGIEVVKKEYKEENIAIERDSVDDICGSSAKIKEIIEVLKRNTVTPSGLCVTMEELMKQGITE